MTRKLPHGFTLTELLVVITIIGILAALVMAGVSGVRKRAQILVCANRQSELAKALLMYETSHQQYPGYLQALPKYNLTLNPATPNHVVVPWTVMILEELGRNDLWTEYRTPGTVPTAMRGSGVSLALSQFVCPSDTRTSLRPLSYVVNCGIKDWLTGNTSAPPDAAANGVFHNLYSFRDMNSSKFFGLDPSQLVRTSSSDIKDGTSSTILLSENCQAWQWCLGPASEPAPVNLTFEPFVGMVWWPPEYLTNTDPLATPRAINMYRTQADYDPSFNLSNLNVAYQFARPASNHDGGVNVAFCDGHVQFLKETIGFPVFAQLMTPNGQNTKNPATGQPLLYRSGRSPDPWFDPIPPGILD